MTDKERLDLMMSTNHAGIIKDDFLKWLFQRSGKHEVPR